MYAAVKLHLVKALEDSKLAKKDKWVKDNAGQCVIRYTRSIDMCLQIFLCTTIACNTDVFVLLAIGRLHTFLHSVAP